MSRMVYAVVLFMIQMPTGAIRNSSADISDECLHCICMVESDCKDPKCVMDLGSLSCGPYQIKDPYWIDCGKPGPSWKECASNKTCAEYCMRQYRIRYQNRIGRCSINCEFQARLHNGGPNGCTTRKNSTDVYWAKVKKCLETGLPWR
ncbi:hypothetical protein ACJMK2_024651 [Sinanodonta woodiana]|uniref:lysozyme n=1 Tax=Sinanodonta woodiana TaxID=1069815 RepID=A0ABD3XG04_SINWO